ncbi:MAG: hypothetical protein JXL97_17615, partial [Bacteroidales bacterium]|nr:hypothetical protein [Bacteroidales bacterium]
VKGKKNMDKNKKIPYKLKPFFEEESIANFKDVTLYLPISLENKYCTGVYFKQIVENVLFFITNGLDIFQNNKPLSISKIRIDIGDTLHRHNIIETNEKLKFEKSLKMGTDWVFNNIDIINKLLPEKNKINTETELRDDITILTNKSAEMPDLEIIRHEYWRKKPQFDIIRQKIENLCMIPNSPIEHSFNSEAEKFFEIKQKYYRNIDKNQTITQSKIYLKEEAAILPILYNETPNAIELYPGGENYFSIAFRSKKAKKDKNVQDFLSNGLKGADKRKNVKIYV